MIHNQAELLNSHVNDMIEPAVRCQPMRNSPTEMQDCSEGWSHRIVLFRFLPLFFEEPPARLKPASAQHACGMACMLSRLLAFPLHDGQLRWHFLMHLTCHNIIVQALAVVVLHPSTMNSFSIAIEQIKTTSSILFLTLWLWKEIT